MTDSPPQKPKVTIYTDGACEPNPGPGGYAAVLIHPKSRKEISGGFRRTTNNRMEMLAAIKALEFLNQPCAITVFSDSKYLVDSIQLGWAARWKKKNWWRTNQERAENFDLWDRLLNLCAEHQVTFQWVRGHAGNIENERCDQLSCAAIKAPNLEIDQGYENKPSNEGGRPRLSQPGEPCRKCATPVQKQTAKPKAGRDFYYEYFLWCPKCNATYEVPEAKRLIEKTPTLL
jgi:ribonuclease HI